MAGGGPYGRAADPDEGRMGGTRVGKAHTGPSALPLLALVTFGFGLASAFGTAARGGKALTGGRFLGKGGGRTRDVCSPKVGARSLTLEILLRALEPCAIGATINR